MWSIPTLLPPSASTRTDDGQHLPYSPLRSLSGHSNAITAIVAGHSFSRNNIAVSAANDNKCVIWDYAKGELMHTFLLPTSPLCLALDPADRAVYAGYEDGSVQFLDFYAQGGLNQQLYDPVAKVTPSHPPPAARWPAQHQPGSKILCIQVNHDGTSLISGHEDGKIHAWDAGRGRYGKLMADLSAPITNLRMLKPSGFPKSNSTDVKLHNVMKPRYGIFANGDNGNIGGVPPNFTFTAQLASNIPHPWSDNSNPFHEALRHPSFPSSLLDEAINDFTAWHYPGKSGTESSNVADLRAENTALSSQLETALARQKSALAEIKDREKAEWRRQKDEEVKIARKKRRRLRRMKEAEVARKKEMRSKLDDGDEKMSDHPESEVSLSSSTDEMSDSI